MKLPKYRIKEIEKLYKYSKEVYNLYFQIKDYLINNLELDEESIIDNLNSIVNNDMSAEDMLDYLKEELEDK